MVFSIEAITREILRKKYVFVIIMLVPDDVIVLLRVIYNMSSAVFFLRLDLKKNFFLTFAY